MHGGWMLRLSGKALGREHAVVHFTAGVKPEFLPDSHLPSAGITPVCTCKSLPQRQL